MLARLEFRLTCGCHSHNGFITQRGMKMKAPKHTLTGLPVAVRVDESVSVSASEPSRAPVQEGANIATPEGGSSTKELSDAR